MNRIKTIYIYHDCFVVRTKQVVLVFDFWMDPYQHGELPNPMQEIEADIPVYVFISHGHKDHYNPTVFNWSEHFHNIRYIVSQDIMKRIRHIVTPDSSYKGVKVDPSRVTCMRSGDKYDDGLVRVHTYASTDVGNSYAIETGGYSLFHAGDLNAWIWKDESTEQEVKKALDDFNRILDDIEDTYRGFDICFFPVDSRIGTDYFTGAKIFLDRFNIKNFFPMHYELGDTSAIARLHRDAAAFDRYASFTCRHYIMSAPYSAYEIISEE